MHSVVACLACGLDPASDTMLINSAVAAAAGVPWLLRHQLMAMARRGYRRLRGMEPEVEACPLPDALDVDDQD